MAFPKSLLASGYSNSSGSRTTYRKVSSTPVHIVTALSSDPRISAIHSAPWLQPKCPKIELMMCQLGQLSVLHQFLVWPLFPPPRVAGVVLAPAVETLVAVVQVQYGEVGSNYTPWCEY